MKIKPTKKFYFGCLIIVLTATYFGSFSYFSILLSIMGLSFFIDLELINIAVKIFGGQNRRVKSSQ